MPGRRPSPFPIVRCIQYFATCDAEYVNNGPCISILNVMKQSDYLMPCPVPGHPLIPTFKTLRDQLPSQRHKYWPHRSFYALRKPSMVDMEPILKDTMRFVNKTAVKTEWVYTVNFFQEGLKELKYSTCMNVMICSRDVVLLLFKDKEEMERARVCTHVLSPAVTRMECYFRCLIRQQILMRMLPDAQLYYSY